MKEYWNQRYEKETQFDWFKSFKQLPSLKRLIPKSSKILHVGCGNSNLPAEMHSNGYRNIINLDYSPVCIRNMKIKFPEQTWIEGDIFDLSEYQDFDIVLDKGTLDALVTEKHDPWDPPQKLLKTIESYMLQVLHALKPEGRFIQITFEQPHFRLKFLSLFNVTVHTLHQEDGFDYFVYECTRKIS